MNKNKKLLEFMEIEIPSKRSKTEILNRKKSEILQLYSSGYAIHQIADYLKIAYKLITSRQTLSKFIKEKHKK